MNQQKTLLKAVIYRALHRGGQEADRILGGFAQEVAVGFDEEDLILFSDLLAQDDLVIFQWLYDPTSCPFPRFYALLKKLADYRPQTFFKETENTHET